jgi:hypothetical protein
MKLIAILCVVSTALAMVGTRIAGPIGDAALYIAGLVAGAMLLIVAAAYRENERERKDNPRCFCPDCGADLGSFYSNRIQMERRK